MNIYSALMMSVTMIMTAVMLPRIYFSWITAQHCDEAEIAQLEQLLAEQNRWIWRHFGCATLAVAMIWMAHNSPNDLGIPASMEMTLACYATVSLFFAVLESLIAQKVAAYLALVPVAMREEKD
ncbi:MAG: hypothetical protein FPO08_05635 [Geobacter sp.]|nr:MAG: hypothetical protein FPO08_05635 [Geobacter sp.]